MRARKAAVVATLTLVTGMAANAGQPARGVETITGVVVDRAGVPVANAEVTLVRAPPGYVLYRPPAAYDLELELAAPRPPRTKARASLDGTFRLEHLSPVWYAVIASVDGVPLAGTLVDAGKHPPPLRLVLDTGRTIEGRIVDERGHPLPGARVLIHTSLFERPPLVVGKDGRFHALAPIDGLPYDAVVTAPGYLRKCQLMIPWEPNTVHLEPSRTIAGVVKLADKPVAGAHVMLGRSWKRTEADGRFAVAGLEPARLDVGAYLESGGFGHVVVDTTRADARHVEIDIVPPPAKPTVVQILDLRGQPIRGATVTVADHTVPYHHPWRKTTDRDGRATFEGLPRRSHALTVAATAPHRAVASVALMQKDSVVLHLARSGDLRLRLVTKLPPKVRRQVRVLVEPPHFSCDVRVFGQAFDARGRLTLKGLAWGRYNVWLDGPVPLPLPAEVTVPRRRPVVLRIPPAGRIRGRVIDPDGRPVEGVDLFLRSDLSAGRRAATSRWNPITARTGADGRFVFEDVGAGRFVVGLRLAPGKMPQWLAPVGPAHAKAGTRRIVFRLRPARRIEGRVLAPDGTPLAGATVVAQPIVPTKVRTSGGTSTDATGAFSLGGLASGEYEVSATALGVDSTDVRVHAGARDVVLRIIGRKRTTPSKP